MVSLTAEQYQMVHFYYHLLNTIEEGFEYVINSYSNLELTEGERLLNDIFSAFYHLDSSHLILKAVFNEESEIIQSFSQFDDVIVTLEQTSENVTSLEQNKELIKNLLCPAYIAWKETVQSNLVQYVSH